MAHIFIMSGGSFDADDRCVFLVIFLLYQLPKAPRYQWQFAWHVRCSGLKKAVNEMMNLVRQA